VIRTFYRGARSDREAGAAAPKERGGTLRCRWGTKAILGNPTMIQAYRDGIPANGKAVPDGAAIAKIEWLKDRDHESPYEVTVPGAQTEMSFMLKDSKRFPDTNGWGYATFVYDASSDSFKPSTTDPTFARACHGRHVAGATARDFVYTSYAQRYRR
jgi:Cytochrome P460